MKRNFYILNQHGFRLIEIMAVLVIMGVLFAVMQHKISALTRSSEDIALEIGIGELNVRETLTWTNCKCSPDGWTDDNTVYVAMDTDLRGGYVWSAGPTAAGGTLQFKSRVIVLTRTPSTNMSACHWE